VASPNPMTAVANSSHSVRKGAKSEVFMSFMIRRPVVHVHPFGDVWKSGQSWKGTRRDGMDA
jgi:hypothetical protein